MDASPDKAALTTVFNYLRNKKLKDTEEALKKELSVLGQGDFSSDSAITGSPLGSSGVTDPSTYEDSYSSCPPSLPTTTDLQSEQQQPLSQSPSPEIDENHFDSDVQIFESSPKEDLPTRPVLTQIFEKRPDHLAFNKLSPPRTLINIDADEEDNNSSPFREPGHSPAQSENLSLGYKRSNSECSNLAVKTSPVGTITTSQLAMGRHLLYQVNTNGTPNVGRQILTPILTVLPSTVGPLAATTLRAGGQPIIFGAPSQMLQSPPLLTGSATNQTTPQSHVTSDCTLPSPVDSLRSSPNISSPPRTLASLLLSEMTPEYVELKNFAEEFKTKRIRLGFTQGAVGQSLAQKGYNNFAQSTISRFEQMQLSPANAAAIKLVLEKWLQEAECPDVQSSPSVPSSVSAVPLMNCRKRKKRAVFTAQTRSNLDELFKQNPRPNRQIIENIADELNLLPEEVRVWFCNKRQKSKQSLSTYERESSVSSYVDSPPSLYEGNKGRSPSPKTPFTIEELSKSSVSTTTTPPLSSSVQLSSLGLVRPLSASTLYPVMFHPPSPPQLIHHNPTAIAQTTA